MASPTRVLSTGQTIQDLILLGQLQNLNPKSRRPAGWVPPALNDPNYVPPVRLKGAHLYSGTAFLAISFLMITWKIVTTQQTRTSKSRLLFLEDWLLLLALAGQITYVVLAWVAQQYQVGWHIYDLRYISLLELYKYTGISNIILIWIYCTSRASLLISIRRMYSPIRTRLKFLIDFLAVGKFFTLVICIFAFIFQVPQHPEAPFNLVSALKNGVNILAADIKLMAVQSAFDTVIMLSPIPLLWKLKNLPRRRRWQILALCGFGILTMSVGYARLGIVIHMQDIIWIDFPWYLPIVGISNNVEIFVVMITACVPTANLFFKWAYNKPGIPAACATRSTRRRRTIRKHRRKKDIDSTIDSIRTEDTYDTDWMKGDTIQSDQFCRPIENPKNLAKIVTIEEAPSALEPVLTKPDSSLSIDKDRDLLPPPTRSSIGNSGYSYRGEASRSSRKSIISLRETDTGDAEEEEDNFYEMLIPSDAFFPFGTGLRPRPPVRLSNSGETHELREV
ncbi:hypothetical protein TWF569_003194 [Orbilia oligospora]|uniref:Integral membrane protein n=2 Tax=Orbilia oligospora TaxID=2813651 RepID=A0A7C8JXD1_ORBOL|nr:hypothetical protein TWF706_010449 [Orbilia oligospora]KAF3098919.1 hypothetical protein TWF102_005962 [Orbilia oligospora]KAF3108186.1 hypothetical protein TWF103_005734 [Orbilia oligospora]KAF3124545.1 hypothetical protein TWF703_011298 [Orbilia oligospora]KAF3133325.1 hypothetical protein TWF594_009271 [Orbilia oligospora]